MSPLLIVLIAVCESVGVGLIGLLVLRALREYPLGHSLIALIVITVGAMNISTITIVLVTGAGLPIHLDLIVNVVVGLMSIGVGVLLGRSLTTGSKRLAEETRSFGQGNRFKLPQNLPTAEFAELARVLRITSDKLVEHRLREQAAEASRRRLVAGIAHDLRTPLGQLSLLAEAVEDGRAADLPDYCRKMRKSAKDLSEMVDDLFELSRIQAGTLRLLPENAELADLISDEVAVVEELAHNRGIVLRAEKIEPVTVRVDVRRIRRAFNNILANAIQYSRPDTTVSVTVRAFDHWALVAVTDECGGIPQPALNAVFDMGWRGTSNKSDTGQGAGLGLAIVRGFVEPHQGRVSVRNVPGGCCFEVWLPSVGQ